MKRANLCNAKLYKIFEKNVISFPFIKIDNLLSQNFCCIRFVQCSEKCRQNSCNNHFKTAKLLVSSVFSCKAIYAIEMHALK